MLSPPLAFIFRLAHFASHETDVIGMARDNFAFALGLPCEFDKENPQVVYREWLARQRMDPARKRVAGSAAVTEDDGSGEAPPLKRPGPTEQRHELSDEEALEKELEALERRKKLLELKERVRKAQREVALLEEKLRGAEKMDE